MSRKTLFAVLDFELILPVSKLIIVILFFLWKTTWKYETGVSYINTTYFGFCTLSRTNSSPVKGGPNPEKK